jgi:hypothetical protein
MADDQRRNRAMDTGLGNLDALSEQGLRPKADGGSTARLVTNR